MSSEYAAEMIRRASAVIEVSSDRMIAAAESMERTVARMCESMDALTASLARLEAQQAALDPPAAPPQRLSADYEVIVPPSAGDHPGTWQLLADDVLITENENGTLSARQGDLVSIIERGKWRRTGDRW